MYLLFGSPGWHNTRQEGSIDFEKREEADVRGQSTGPTDTFQSWNFPQMVIKRGSCAACSYKQPSK